MPPHGPVSGFTCHEARARDVGNEKSEKFILSKISGVIGARAQTRTQEFQTIFYPKNFSFTVNLDILPDQCYIKDVN